MNQTRKESAVTLIALVVTLVIMLILVAIAMNMLIGDNGLLNKTKDAVNIHYGAQVNELEALNNLTGEIIDKTEEAPKIQEVKTSSTTNSITVEVIAIRAKKYIFSYKKQGTDEWMTMPEQEENIYTFQGLEDDMSYTIKIEVTNDKGQVETETEEKTKKMTEGIIAFTNLNWENERASVDITSTTEEYAIQYQINNEIGEWTSGTHVSGLDLNDIVYARLWDGFNEGSKAYLTVTDIIEPNEAGIQLSSQNTNTQTVIKATVTQTDSQSGVNIAECKWEYNAISTPIGTEPSKYTGTFTSTTQEIDLSATLPQNYYLHVLTVDRAGNKKETVSPMITVQQLVIEIIMNNSANVNVGATIQLNAVVNPSNANNKSLTWQSNNTGIATVNNNGLVTGIAAGSATITATTQDGSGKSASCIVYVNAAPIITGNSFNSKTINSITINAQAVDANGGNLNYKLYISTYNTGGWVEKANITAVQNTPVILTAYGLANYTNYYYYIWVSDGSLTTQTGASGAIRTYCPGTGINCDGPFTTTKNCTACKGRRRIF